MSRDASPLRLRQEAKDNEGPVPCGSPKALARRLAELGAEARRPWTWWESVAQRRTNLSAAACCAERPEPSAVS